jgi:hypothetical protein
MSFGQGHFLRATTERRWNRILIIKSYRMKDWPRIRDCPPNTAVILRAAVSREDPSKSLEH